MPRTPQYDFIIKQGATFKCRMRFKVNGVVQSLVGAVIQMFVQPDDSSSDINLLSTDLPSANHSLVINTTDPNDNFVEITFFPVFTNAITWKQATYWMDVTGTDTVVRRKLKGRFIHEPKPL